MVEHSQTEIGTDIDFATLLLKKGEVIGLPTETVYGLAGNALNTEAVLKIFSVKNRPHFNPLILHVPSTDALLDYVMNVPSVFYDLAKACTPGPITFLLDKKSIVSDLVTAGSPRVAIRIPNHPLALKLLQKVEFPLAAPSANPFGYISPTTPQHVWDQLNGRIPYILDGGPCTVGIESTIIGFEDGQVQIFRKGGISIEAIEEIAGPVSWAEGQTKPEAPGMLSSHYAPGKPFLVGNVAELISQHEGKKIGLITLEDHGYQVHEKHVLAENGSLDEAAQHIFSVMRVLDQSEVDIIIAEWMPEMGLGRAINDRLARARLK